MPENSHHSPQTGPSQVERDALAAVPLEWEITDQQREQYSANRSWPMKCAWCRDGSETHVPLPDVAEVAFHCDLCGKANLARRQGNRLSSTPTYVLGSVRALAIAGVLLLVVAATGILWWVLVQR